MEVDTNVDMEHQSSDTDTNDEIDELEFGDMFEGVSAGMFLCFYAFPLLFLISHLII